MNVIDSSAWIEYFTGGPNSGFFASAIERVNELIVPTLTIFEVFKWIARERDEVAAVHAIGHMQQGELVELDGKLAVLAARLSLRAKLPLADSIVYATARLRNATLWTQDGDLDGLDGVQHVAKKKTTK